MRTENQPIRPTRHAPGRRMRRSKSAQPAHRRARPFQTLPEFSGLSREQLACVHDILRTKTLAEAQQQIWSELHCRLDEGALHRYKQKLLLAEALALVDDATTAVDQLNDLFAGRPAGISAAGMLVVQQRALALASDPKTKPAVFASLHRIFTYEERKAERERAHTLRAEQAARLEVHREAVRAHRQAVLEHQKLAESRRHEMALRREDSRAQLAADQIEFNAHRKKMDVEKLKLAQQRIALELRREEKRGAQNESADEQQKAMTEKIAAIMAYGRAYLAQENARQSVDRAVTGAPPAGTSSGGTISGGTSSASPALSPGRGDGLAELVPPVGHAPTAG